MAEGPPAVDAAPLLRVEPRDLELSGLVVGSETSDVMETSSSSASASLVGGGLTWGFLSVFRTLRN